MAEVKAYDYKWFDEIGGNEALQEIGELREQASGLTQRAPDLWDSAPLEEESTPEADTPAEVLSTPPTSG